MARSNTNVRIGPISLITLISILILAVMSMLCVTTTRANYAMATRQAESTAETYALDAVAQDALSQVDAVLKTSASAQGAATSINSQGAAIATSALASTAEAGITTDDLSAEVTADGTNVQIKVTAASGKALNAEVELLDDRTYSINEWKTTTAWEEQQETLWSGGASK